ncbi:MAG TPA: SRPBCC family protein [Candidatus Dormibacteraeota bacterium]|nr:SRPBCC family protein [Candidatus Dormibacteraeota bacterium]
MNDVAATRVITITRTFDAPREIVFRAWTEAERLAQWWGPEGFTVSLAESDPRVGGVLKLVMHGPDGIDLPMTAAYREIVPPELLVVESTTVGADGNRVLASRHRVTFADRGGRTEITLHAEATALVPEAIAMLGGMRAGWNQSLQCLDDVLSGTVERQLVVTRLLQATPDRVFAMWTERDHVSKWWGPTGFSITLDEMDVRPGGKWRFTMHGPDGVDYPNQIVYDEVNPPERLVYTHLAPRFTTTVTFDEMMGMTVLTLRLVFESTNERNLTNEKYHAREGAEQTLTRLAGLVRAQVATV